MALEITKIASANLIEMINVEYAAEPLQTNGYA